MFKGIKVFVDSIKLVLKYGGLITVVLGILVFASDALDKWQKENNPEEEAKK